MILGKLGTRNILRKRFISYGLRDEKIAKKKAFAKT